MGGLLLLLVISRYTATSLAVMPCVCGLAAVALPQQSHAVSRRLAVTISLFSASDNLKPCGNGLLAICFGLGSQGSYHTWPRPWRSNYEWLVGCQPRVVGLVCLCQAVDSPLWPAGIHSGAASS